MKNQAFMAGGGL